MKRERDLKEMSLEELWRLFPINLVPYEPVWMEWASEEIKCLKGILSGYEPVMNHIGSTAIPQICAKPIIDILVEIPHFYDWETIIGLMESAGYILMSKTDKRMSFNKGYTPQGYAERVFHIHFHVSGDNDELLFRDFLIQNPNVAREYEKLKLSLVAAYRNNRDGYTGAKTDFILKVMKHIKHQPSFFNSF